MVFSAPTRWAIRLVELYAGLVLYGVSMALMVASGLGNMPWDVFHQGIAGTVGGSIGTISIVVGALVLLLWIPLRERPGLGTVSNVFIIGLSVDLTLLLVDHPDQLWLRVVFATAGVVLNAVATAAYVGAGLGPGPRDGLMTGLHRRTGWSIRLVRTGIEVSVVLAGFALGGTLGVATVAYALAVGPLVQLMLPWFAGAVPAGSAATAGTAHADRRRAEPARTVSQTTQAGSAATAGTAPADRRRAEPASTKAQRILL